MLTEKQQFILKTAQEKKEYNDYFNLCLETKTCPDCGNDLETKVNFGDSQLICRYCGIYFDLKERK